MINVSKENLKFIDDFLAKNRENMINELSSLMEINSVSQKNAQIKPYGQPCRDVLDKALALGEKHGFVTHNYDYHVGKVSYGDSEKEIGFWSHLDVVPQGNGWINEPFKPVYKQGYLIGRGGEDNKGAAIMALYTMLCLREMDIPLNHKISLMLGTNEEVGMADISYFTKNYKCPDFSIIADAGFPVCFGEKGILELNIESNIGGSQVADVKAGAASNVVPDSAMIKLKNMTNPNLPNAENVKITTCDEFITIESTGVSAHAASPENGINAIGILSKYILDNALVSDSTKTAFELINSISNSCDGGDLAINFQDELSGKLTCNGGILTFDGNNLLLNLNIRYPITMKNETIIDAINKSCNKHGSLIKDYTDSAPNYFPKEHKAVKTLTNIYNEITGSETIPYVMGGGTYARKLPNAVVFGAGLHNAPKKPFPSGHGGGHQPDEALNIDNMLEATKIYIISILSIDSIDFE